MRNFWQIEFPVGDAMRGPAFGERCDPASIGIGTIISGIGAGASVLGALSGMGKSAPSPSVSKTTTMPTPDDEAMRAAKRRSIATQQQRRGRQSTILNDDSSGDLLGA